MTVDCVAVPLDSFLLTLSVPGQMYAVGRAIFIKKSDFFSNYSYQLKPTCCPALAQLVLLRPAQT